MIYYAVAMTVTLILCYYNTTVYSLPGGLEVKGFQTWKRAFRVLLPLAFLAAFRWDVGVDSLYQGSYWQAFHASADGLNSREFEPGFYWFMRFFAEQEIPYFWFLFTLALIFMVCVSFSFYRGSVWTRWSILVFFLLAVYFDCYSSLRQSLAEAISLIAWAQMGYRAPSKKKDIQILIIFLIACLFHQTALMNIPIYFISKIRFSRNGMLKFIIVAIILSPVIQVLIQLVSSLLASKYDVMGVARINAIMTGVLAIICWYFYDEISSLDENAYMYINYAVCAFVLILNSGAMPLPYRVFDMLKIGYVFVVPCLLRGIRRKKTRLALEVFLLAVFGAWFVNYFYFQDSFAANYQSAFSDWSTIIHLP